MATATNNRTRRPPSNPATTFFLVRHSAITPAIQAAMIKSSGSPKTTAVIDRHEGAVNGAELCRHRRRISRHILEDLRDDVVGGDAFGFGLEIQNQTMPKRRSGGALEVVKADVEPALGQRADFAGENQGLSAARAAAEAELLIGNLRGGFGLRVWGQDHTYGGVLVVTGLRHFTNELLQFHQADSVNH